MRQTDKNLKPFRKAETPEELAAVREAKRKAGQASGKARRLKRDTLKCLQALLEAPYKDTGKTGAEVLASQLFAKAAEGGDMSAIREILDRIHGKPNQGLTIDQPEREQPSAGLAAIYEQFRLANAPAAPGARDEQP